MTDMFQAADRLGLPEIQIHVTNRQAREQDWNIWKIAKLEVTNRWPTGWTWSVDMFCLAHLMFKQHFN